MAAAAEALLLAQRGELKQEALARTAVASAETKTDTVWWQALTHEDLATVLERATRIDEARDALEHCLTRKCPAWRFAPPNRAQESGSERR